MFKFHKIGNEIAQGWYCLITSEEEMKAHMEHIGRRVWRNWGIIKDSPNNKEGHCATSEAGAYKQLLTLEMARRNVEEISVVEAIKYLTEIATKPAINIFVKEGKVYVSHNGACRPNTSLLENEEILEKRTCKDYIYPVHSKSEYKIDKWPGGNHFYIMENGNSIPIDGKIKWKTIQAAEDALHFHCRRMEREKEHYSKLKSK